MKSRAAHLPKHLSLQIQNQSQWRMPRQFLQAWVERASELVQQKSRRWPTEARELTLVFLDPKPAQKLNQKFRKKNYATDILSFDPLEPESLGELVICCDVVQRQSGEHAHSFQLELGYMLIHGILHLLGYDHEQGARKAQQMYALQDQIFEVMRDEHERKRSKKRTTRK